MRIDLSGTWRLYYRAEEGRMPETPTELMKADWPHISARVPGNVEIDLNRAGIEPDPFFAENIYRFRKYEFYQWWFEKEVDVPAEWRDEPVEIAFEGLDTFAEIFINGVKVGESANMFIAHSFSVGAALRYGAANSIHVRIRSAINSVRDHDFPVMSVGCENSDEFTLVRKAVSSFGWDIMPRFLSAGMWRGAELRTLPKTRLTQAYIACAGLTADGGMRLCCRVRYRTDAAYLDGFSVRIRGLCGDSAFQEEKQFLFTSGEMTFTVPKAKLWWPLGYGEQNLYSVRVELIRDGSVADAEDMRIGLRVLEVVNTPLPGDEGEFLIKCNGCPILIKGSNWVPMDAMHSRDAERYDAALALFRDCGCNIVRCWGGNVYEDHRFFDLCDEYGILVWQDFAMCCSSYSPEESLKRALEEEATAVVKKLRNHASLLLWAGDNECDGFMATRVANDSARYNELTREVLPRVVRMHDPYRFYLPSSPYVPAGMAEKDAPEQHNWGARAYFKDDYYKHSSAHFISECGYHGCPAIPSLSKFLPEEELPRWSDSSAWKTHNTDYLPKGERNYDRNALMLDQVELFFGEKPRALERLCKLSQIVQAEAMKFFVERTRIKKWRRTGIIWWNMIDGWPQISDAVVDYYYAKKLAYHYIKRVQTPVCLMMDELADWERRVVLGNDSRDAHTVAWQVEDGDTGAILAVGDTRIAANENVSVASVREMAGVQKLYILRWRVNGVSRANHCLAGYPKFDPEQVLGYVERIRSLPEPFSWDIE